MNAADTYRYSNRYEIDCQIEAMRNRIIAERRSEIGRQAAWQEAINVTTGWYRAQYNRIENEVAARWGIDA
jgi:uncharacterized membrane protein